MKRIIITLSILCFVVAVAMFNGCVVQKDEDTLSDDEQALAQHAISTITFGMKALKNKENYSSNNNGAAYGTTTGCPTIDWWDQCHWTVDFGSGCQAADGNYYSGSFSALSCEKLEYENFCANGECVDGTVFFTENASCSADKCYQATLDLVFTTSSDTVSVDYDATTGVSGGTVFYLYAGSYEDISSQVYGNYSAKVLTDLMMDSKVCEHPTVGVIEINATGYDTITIDFNTGDCHTAYVNGIEVSLD